MSIRKALDKEVFGPTRYDVFYKIGLHADIEDTEALKASFYNDQPLRFIDINWDNFKIHNHWYQDFQLKKREEPVRGTVFQFSSDIYGDSQLIQFLVGYLSGNLDGIYRLEWEYVTLSLFITLFGPDQHDPEKIALRRKNAVQEIQSAVKEINTEAALFKYDIDLFIEEQVELQAQRVLQMKQLYPTINKL